MSGSHTPSSPPAASKSSVSDDRLSDKKKNKPQARQLLSCLKCRERKVKCDRMQPCSACCARGHPKECQFSYGESANFKPIQQSLELRRLRAENKRLKERLLEAKVAISDDDEVDSPVMAQSAISRSTQRMIAFEDAGDSIYFGNPGLVDVVKQLHRSSRQDRPFNMGVASEASQPVFLNTMASVSPLNTDWPRATWVQAVREILEPMDETIALIQCFTAREKSAAITYAIDVVSPTALKAFLTNYETNAMSHPALLALFCIMFATELQLRRYERESPEDEDINMGRENARMGAAMSATLFLLKQSSFPTHPTLLATQTICMLATAIANHGVVLEGWNLLGLSVRVGQNMGLHRNSRALDPVPSLRESESRKALWWCLMQNDQQWSSILGRPLAISAIGDCPCPEALTTDASLLRLSACSAHLTLLGRQILGSGPLSNARINAFVDKLEMLLDTLPAEVQFQSSWVDDESQIPESPLDEDAALIHAGVHSYLIMLNQQRFQHFSDATTPSSSTTRKEQSPPMSASGYKRTWHNIALSSQAIINVLDYFCTHKRGCLANYVIKQQGFSAAQALLSWMHEHRSMAQQEHIKTAYQVFMDLSENALDPFSTMAGTYLKSAMRELVAELATLRHSDPEHRGHYQPDTRRSSASLPRSHGAMYSNQTEDEDITMTDTAATTPSSSLGATPYSAAGSVRGSYGYAHDAYYYGSGSEASGSVCTSYGDPAGFQHAPQQFAARSAGRYAPPFGTELSGP